MTPVLQAVGMAEAGGEPMDFEQAASELGLTLKDLLAEVDLAEEIRLIGPLRSEPEASALLMRAGYQYLALEGRVDQDALCFLADVIDDLHARDALMRAGRTIVGQFWSALSEGSGLAYLEDLLPPAFRGAVDERLALGMFAAAVALMARLSSGDAAGCVAEEIIAVTLLREASDLLDERSESGALTAEEAKIAKSALRNLFDLFGDDDVLLMFEMVDPADAAVAGHSAASARLGTVDQRLDAWFHPFGPTAATGAPH